jgi:hypothetical protein
MPFNLAKQKRSMVDKKLALGQIGSVQFEPWTNFNSLVQFTVEILQIPYIWTARQDNYLSNLNRFLFLESLNKNIYCWIEQMNRIKHFYMLM